MKNQKQQILFIDDDLTMHSLITTFLEKMGYHCACASNGSQGLSLITQIKPDLILLDYKMPDFNGDQLYNELVTNPAYQDYKNIPVIFLTAKEIDPSIVQNFWERGVSAYLKKPFGLQELHNVIENVSISNEIKLRNLTLQQEIQQTKDYLELLFNTIPIGILSCDHYGIIKKVNSYFLQILELDHSEPIIGKNIQDYDFFKNTKILNELMKTITHGTAFSTCSFIYVTRNSNRISLKLKAVPFSNNGGTIIIVQDITVAEQKDHELAMLGQISHFMHSMHRLDELLHLILTAITAGYAFGFSRAMVLLINKKTNMLEGSMGVGPANQQEANRIWTELARENISLTNFLAKYGLKFSNSDVYFNNLVKQIKIPLNQPGPIFSKIINEKIPVKINKDSIIATNDNIFRHEMQMDEFLAVPLIAKDKVIGVVIADNKFSNRSIDENMIGLLMIFASQAGLAVERAEAYHELEQEKNKLEKACDDLKNTQGQLIHSERLATVGRMTAEIAHEIRNPLVAIGGFARNILKIIESDSHDKNLYTNANIIADEVSRLENILSNVLDFSKLSELNVCLGNINIIIQDSYKLLKIHEGITSKRINIFIDLEESLPLTLFDPQQMKQVLLNICENAIYSISNNGELFISTRLRDKDKIEIEIRDNGKGIPPHVLEEMFNPFFTTKKNGIGLGLSISQQIIHNHHGKIDVKSELGKGTTFTIRLKIIEDIDRFYQKPITFQNIKS